MKEKLDRVMKDQEDHSKTLEPVCVCVCVRERESIMYSQYIHTCTILYIEINVIT